MGFLSVVGGHLWSGSDDKTIRVWDVTRANKCIATLTGHAKGVVSLAHVTRDVWKPNNTGGRSSTSQMFTPSATDKPNTPGLSGDMSTAVVSGCMDGSIRVWHARSYVPHACVCFSS
mgnify:CR=1 FL=1